MVGGGGGLPENGTNTYVIFRTPPCKTHVECCQHMTFPLNQRRGKHNKKKKNQKKINFFNESLSCAKLGKMR